MHLIHTIIVVTALGAESASSKAEVPRQAEIVAALKPFNQLVGSWKGTASPLDRESKRKRVFWKETNQWEWSFSKERVGLTWKCADGKRVKEGFLTYNPETKQYELTVQFVDGTGKFTGTFQDGRLDLDGPVDAGVQSGMLLSLPNDKRFVYYLLTRQEGRTRYQQVLEVGNTREGVQFAAGSSGPVCIVTGGQGTMQVSYQGKTYYVCCSGCKQAFEEDPAKFVNAAKK